MYYLHGGPAGIGPDDIILIGLGVLMLGGALVGWWLQRRKQA